MAIYRFGAFELNDTTGAQLEFGTAQAIARKVSSSRLARRWRPGDPRAVGQNAYSVNSGATLRPQVPA